MPGPGTLSDVVTVRTVGAGTDSRTTRPTGPARLPGRTLPRSAQRQPDHLGHAAVRGTGLRPPVDGPGRLCTRQERGLPRLDRRGDRVDLAHAGAALVVHRHRDVVRLALVGAVADLQGDL